MKRLALALVLLTVTSSPALAWGAAAHRYIMDRAIDLLPPELHSFFDHYRVELVLRVVDPDTWRTAGWEDDANHFLNLGAREYGNYPFSELPREYGAALEKFGMVTLRRNGLLPWRAQEEFGNLRRAFEEFRRKAPSAPSNVVLFSAVAAHYFEDATMPLHASNNYDGQFTSQNGVHARFETALFERYRSKLTVEPAPATPMTNPRDAAFEIALASYQSVPELLESDKAAIAGRDTYDDEYFERFFLRARPLLERRLSAAITATASLIMGAWTQAGRPALAIDVPQALQRVRNP
jgi:hypothetical protein